MNNVKLSIFTGVQDTDIIDLGLYSPSIEGVVEEAMGMTLAETHAFQASILSAKLSPAIDSLNNDQTGKYNSYKTEDLLGARDYLVKLKIACDTYPACMIGIETL